MIKTANPKINLASIKIACAALPDKDPMISLIFNNECSAASTNMTALARLPTLDLLQMLPVMALDEANLVARDKEGLRNLLIDRIVGLPGFKGLGTVGQSKSKSSASGTIIDTNSFRTEPRVSASSLELSNEFGSSQKSLDANAGRPIHSKGDKSSSDVTNTYVYLSCDDIPDMARQIQSDFASTKSRSIASIKTGSMKPNGSTGHGKAIPVLQIELSDSSVIGPLVKYVLSHHNSAKLGNNESYSSFVLTHDRKHANLAKEALREVCSSGNSKQQVRTFVGRAGTFVESST